MAIQQPSFQKHFRVTLKYSQLPINHVIINNYFLYKYLENQYMKKDAEDPVNMPSNQKFGWLFSAIFTAGFGYSQWTHSPKWAIISASLAVLFILLTICAPAVLAPFNKVWFALGLFLGKVVSPIVLSIIFFILITPVAMVTRFFGRDALLIKKREVSTYWVEKESIDPESFKNQF